MSEQPADQDQILAAGEVLVDGGELAGETDRAPHRRGVGRHVVAEYPRPPLVGSQQGGEDPDGRRLAGPVRPEDAVHGAGRDL